VEDKHEGCIEIPEQGKIGRAIRGGRGSGLIIRRRDDAVAVCQLEGDKRKNMILTVRERLGFGRGGDPR
jgi:hypothetical protein